MGTHVLFECPTYDVIRAHSGLTDHLRERDVRIMMIHRDIWSWKQLRQIRRFLCDVMCHRASLAGGTPRGVKSYLQDKAERLWTSSSSSSSSRSSASSSENSAS